MNPVDLLGAMKRTVQQLATFNEIAKALTSTLELGEVLDLIGERGSQLLGAERWSLLLLRDDGRLQFEIVKGPNAERLHGQTLSPNEGIAGAVLATGKARLVADTRADPDFSQRFDSLTATTSRSVIAVPLSVRGRSLGVLELVAEHPVFTEDDLRAATTVADFAAIAIENARNFSRVQELTLIDEHTGLFNARHLSSLLDAEVARCSSFNRTFSLLFLDVDGFKRVNDGHGHLVGSAALKIVGERISANVRGVDSVFRYGGDEFAALLVETGRLRAASVAARVLAAMNSTPLQVSPALQLPVSISIGVAAFPENGADGRAVLEAADQAMYRAKREGRNRWLFAG